MSNLTSQFLAGLGRGAGSGVWLFAQVRALWGPCAPVMPHFLVNLYTAPTRTEENLAVALNEHSYNVISFFFTMASTHCWPPCYFYTAKMAIHKRRNSLFQDLTFSCPASTI